MCPLLALQLTPASSRGARPTLTLWVWTCPPTVTPWCTPVSQVISSPGVQSTGSAALTAAGLARCRSAEVRGRQRSDRANDGEDGGGRGGAEKLKCVRGRLCICIKVERRKVKSSVLSLCMCLVFQHLSYVITAN